MTQRKTRAFSLWRPGGAPAGGLQCCHRCHRGVRPQGASCLLPHVPPAPLSPWLLLLTGVFFFVASVYYSSAYAAAAGSHFAQEGSLSSHGEAGPQSQHLKQGEFEGGAEAPRLQNRYIFLEPEKGSRKRGQPWEERVHSVLTKARRRDHAGASQDGGQKEEVVGGLQHKRLSVVPSSADMGNSLLQLDSQEVPVDSAREKTADPGVDHQESASPSLQQPQSWRELQSLRENDEEGPRHERPQEQSSATHRAGPPKGEPLSLHVEGEDFSTSSQAEKQNEKEKKMDAHPADSQNKDASVRGPQLASPQQIRPAIVSEPVKYSFAAGGSGVGAPVPSSAAEKIPAADQPPSPLTVVAPNTTSKISPAATVVNPPVPLSTPAATPVTAFIDAEPPTLQDEIASARGETPPVDATAAAPAAVGTTIPHSGATASTTSPSPSPKNFPVSSHVSSFDVASSGASDQDEGVTPPLATKAKKGSLGTPKEQQPQQQSLHPDDERQALQQQERQHQQVPLPQYQRQQGENQVNVSNEMLQQRTVEKADEAAGAAQAPAAFSREEGKKVFSATTEAELGFERPVESVFAEEAATSGKPSQAAHGAQESAKSVLSAVTPPSTAGAEHASLDREGRIYSPEAIMNSGVQETVNRPDEAATDGTGAVVDGAGRVVDNASFAASCSTRSSSSIMSTNGNKTSPASGLPVMATPVENSASTNAASGSISPRFDAGAKTTSDSGERSDAAAAANADEKPAEKNSSAPVAPTTHKGIASKDGSVAPPSSAGDISAAESAGKEDLGATAAHTGDALAGAATTEHTLSDGGSAANEKHSEPPGEEGAISDVTEAPPNTPTVSAPTNTEGGAESNGGHPNTSESSALSDLAKVAKREEGGSGLGVEGDEYSGKMGTRDQDIGERGSSDAQDNKPTSSRTDETEMNSSGALDTEVSSPGAQSAGLSSPDRQSAEGASPGTQDIEAASPDTPARDEEVLHQHSLFALLLLLVGLFVFGGLSAAGGIGGGSVFVALLVGLGRIPICYAIPVSKVMVFSSSFSTVWSQRFLEGQGAVVTSSPSAVARDWVNLLVPMAMSGTLVGVLLNTIAPASYLLLLLALLLLLLSSRTIFTAYKTYKDEEVLRGQPAFDDMLPCYTRDTSTAASPPTASAGAPSPYTVSHSLAGAVSAAPAFPTSFPLPAIDAASSPGDYRRQHHQRRLDSLATSKQDLPLPVFTRSAAHTALPPSNGLHIRQSTAAGSSTGTAGQLIPDEDVAASNVAIDPTENREEAAAAASGKATPAVEREEARQQAVYGSTQTFAAPTSSALASEAPIALAATVSGKGGSEREMPANIRPVSGETSSAAAADVREAQREDQRNTNSIQLEQLQQQQLEQEQEQQSIRSTRTLGHLADSEPVASGKNVCSVSSRRGFPDVMADMGNVSCSAEEAVLRDSKNEEKEEKNPKATSHNGDANVKQGQRTSGRLNKEGNSQHRMSPAAEEEAIIDNSACKGREHLTDRWKQEASASDSRAGPCEDVTKNNGKRRGRRDEEKTAAAAADVVTSGDGGGVKADRNEEVSPKAGVADAKVTDGDISPSKKEDSISGGVDRIGVCGNANQRQLQRAHRQEHQQQQVESSGSVATGVEHKNAHVQEESEATSTNADEAEEEVAAATSGSTAPTIVSAIEEKDSHAKRCTVSERSETPYAGKGNVITYDGYLSDNPVVIGCRSKKKQGENHTERNERQKPHRQQQHPQQDDAEAVAVLDDDKEKQLQQDERERLRRESREEAKHQKRPSKCSRRSEGSQSQGEERPRQQNIKEQQQQHQHLQQKLPSREEEGLQQEEDENHKGKRTFVAGDISSEKQPKQQQANSMEKNSGQGNDRDIVPQQVTETGPSVQETRKPHVGKPETEGKEEDRRNTQSVKQQEGLQQTKTTGKSQKVSQEREVSRQEETGKPHRPQHEKKQHQKMKKSHNHKGEKYKEHAHEKDVRVIGGKGMLDPVSSARILQQSSSTMYCTHTSSPGEPLAGVPTSPTSASTSTFPLFYTLDDEEDLSHISVCLNGSAEGEEPLAPHAQREQQRLLQEFEKTAARGIQQLLPPQQRTNGLRDTLRGEVSKVAEDGRLSYSTRRSSRHGQVGSKSREIESPLLAAQVAHARRGCSAAAAAAAAASFSFSSSPSAAASQRLLSRRIGDTAEASRLYDRGVAVSAGGLRRGQGNGVDFQTNELFNILSSAYTQSPPWEEPQQQQQCGDIATSSSTTTSATKGMAAVAQRLLSSSAGAAHRLALGHRQDDAVAPTSSLQRGSSAVGSAQKLPLLSSDGDGNTINISSFSEPSMTTSAATDMCDTPFSPYWGDNMQPESDNGPSNLCEEMLLRSRSSLHALGRCIELSCGALQLLQQHIRKADAAMFQPPSRQPNYLSLVLLLLMNVFCSVLLHEFLSKNKRKAAVGAAVVAVAAGAYFQVRLTMSIRRLWNLPQAFCGGTAQYTMKEEMQQLWKFAVSMQTAAAAAAVRGCQAVSARLPAWVPIRRHPRVHLGEHRQQTLLQPSVGQDIVAGSQRSASPPVTSGGAQYVPHNLQGDVHEAAREAGLAATAAEGGKTSARVALELPLVHPSTTAASSCRSSNAACTGRAEQHNIRSVQNSGKAPIPINSSNPFSPPQSPSSSPQGSPHATNPFPESTGDNGRCILFATAVEAAGFSSSVRSNLHRHRDFSCAAGAYSPDARKGASHPWGSTRNNSHSTAAETVEEHCEWSSSCSSSPPVVSGAGDAAPLPVRSTAVLLLTPFVGFFTGVFAGLIGVGGGVVFSPFLLILGEDPVVAVATASTCVVFTSASTSLQFLLIGRLPLLYALLFGAVAAVAAIAAACGMQRIRRACGGRKSLVAGCVAAAVSLGSLLILWRCVEVWILGKV